RLQQRLRSRLQTRAGRAQLRERVGVEHSLAHLANRQGPKARYRGTRRNLFDLRRLGVVQNLEVAARYQLAA
ncbi:IS5/IS1182 family transposase, partial [Myxococcus sp. 1LA]